MSTTNDPNLPPPSGPAAPASAPMVPPNARTIVSVNNRGAASSGLAGKVIFVVILVAVVVVGSLFAINRMRANNKAKEAAADATSKSENKGAEVGKRRQFDSDPPPLPNAGKGSPGDATAAAAGASPTTCPDGSQGTVLIGPDNKPVVSNGSPMRVCPGGKVLVPAIAGAGTGAPPIPMAGGQAGSGQTRQASNGQPAPSRYGGDVMVPGPGMTGSLSGSLTGTSNSPATSQGVALLQALLAKQGGAAGSGGAAPGIGGGTGATGAGGQVAASGEAPKSPPGSIGSMLTPSQTPLVQASMLGDRNMILPKGRSIDCGMSMRLVNELAGQASCVVSDDVYSDNGRVLLLPKGSEATGEYGSATAQGQSRIFVLWTRVKTPDGVVINLNSPAADALGTSGLDGYVDNHWWQRIGAAFLLSFVQDAIAYETAKAAGPSGVTTFQNTASTGNNMAEKVLESTINIKPTIYKNQGDRASIYVARDLDFSSVYALRAR